MCTAQLYGHCTGTVLSIGTRTNTKHWKVWQLTYGWYQHLQHHWLIPDRILKRLSDPICTTTARTCQQDCHYCSVLQLSVATTIIIFSTHLKITFMANISVSLYELYNSQPALCSQFSTVIIVTDAKLQTHNRTAKQPISVVPCEQNHTQQYTGCHRRNGPNFGRVFLMLNYTDITQNTCIRS